MFTTVLFFAASVIGHLAFIAMFLIIGDLSKILGSALKKKPLYKMMYVASAMLVLGLILDFIPKLGVVAMLCDLIGVLVACFVTYYYWKWLPADLAKG